jgi:hypothetical protein
MESQSSDSMSFQKVVLIVAIIVLILMLSFIGYMMYYTEQSKPYPPTLPSQCPDTWNNDGTTKCKNTADSTSKMFSNIGSFITDTSCSLISNDNSCNAIVGVGPPGKCSNPWVRGNVSNGLSSDNCYLLGSWGARPIDKYGTFTGLEIDILDSGSGSGYTNGLYNNIQLIYHSGTKLKTYPTANITVAGGVVSGLAYISGGTYIDSTTKLTAKFGGGSGFIARVIGTRAVPPTITPSNTLSYTLKSNMADNISWAKTYGITWDGFN